MEICSNVKFLSILKLILLGVKIIKIIVPILLILMCSIQVVKAVVSNEKDLSNIWSLIKNKVIAALCVFLIPTIVTSVASFASNLSETNSCINNATSEKISELAYNKIQNYLSADSSSYSAFQEMQTLIDYIIDEDTKSQMKEDIASYKSALDESNSLIFDSDSTNFSTDYSDRYYTTAEPAQNFDDANYSLSKFTYDASKYNGYELYGGSFGIIKSFYCNSLLIGELDEIFREISEYALTIPDALKEKYIYWQGCYANKGGKHGVGAAVDLFSGWSYTDENGNNYYPYSGQSLATWERYKEFICEVCNGDETCPENINFNIYYKIFWPRGWCWGGLWSGSYFDPMHFEYPEKEWETCKIMGEQRDFVDCSE